MIGAHSAGFNTGSVGVAVLGDYSTKTLPPAAKTALEQAARVAARSCARRSALDLPVDLGRQPPLPQGIPVFLRAISGHRDTDFTDCPGNALYAELPQIAKDVAALGGPKIYAPARRAAG